MSKSRELTLAREAERSLKRQSPLYPPTPPQHAFGGSILARYQQQGAMSLAVARRVQFASRPTSQRGITFGKGIAERGQA